jgi:hypothetical protein
MATDKGSIELFIDFELSEDDLKSLIGRFGFTETYYSEEVRRSIEMAAFWYHMVKLPTHRQVLPHVQRAGKFAGQLADELKKCWPLRLEPAGFLESLRQLQITAANTVTNIKAEPKERGRPGKLQEWVEQMIAIYEQGTGRTAGYTRDSTKEKDVYTGDFLSFVHEVAKVCGVEASDSVISKAIDRYRRERDSVELEKIHYENGMIIIRSEPSE